MISFRSYRPLVLAALATALILTGIGSAAAADPATHIRGTIESVTASGFTVQTQSGTQTIAVGADTKIIGVVPSSLDAIKSGTFVGTANVERRGQARALEMVVFPDSMKGTGLGDYPWDLSGKSGGSSAMTNGTVKRAQTGAASGSTMTNGTVKKASRSGPLKLVVDYGKGEKTITVPADVPVVTFQPTDKSSFIKGAHVFVAGKPGQPVNAGMVAVGLNGTVPPM